jgi:putative membrane protein
MCTWAGGGWWFLWPLWFAGFWIVVALILRFGVWGRRRGHWSPSSTAEGILAERFARDEITEKEYRDRLAVLHGSGGAR